jgi:sRNA-binding protein
MSDDSDKLTDHELYIASLELLQFANAWEPDVRLLGNVKASTIRDICRDYVRMKLENGITFDKPKK